MQDIIVIAIVSVAVVFTAWKLYVKFSYRKNSGCSERKGCDGCDLDCKLRR